MNTICPVCNCFASFTARCPVCGQILQDGGRLSDYFGNYSPYLPIDQGKWSNGLPDLVNHLCIHVGWCQLCAQEERIAIQEVSEESVTASDYDR